MEKTLAHSTEEGGWIKGLDPKATKAQLLMSNLSTENLLHGRFGWDAEDTIGYD